ncbi:MAG: hypothetical protein ACSHW0_18605 [Thalassotalea sp.]
MKSAELIKSLSEQGTEDLYASSQWINPIPDDAFALIEKIEMAARIVQFSQSRRDEDSGKKSPTQHLDALIRLKSEIKTILSKS